MYFYRSDKCKTGINVAYCCDKLFLLKVHSVYISGLCTNIFCTHVQALVREQTTRSASLKFLCSFWSLLVLNRFISTKLSNDFEIQALKKQFSLKIFSNTILCEDFLLGFVCLFACFYLFALFWLSPTGFFHFNISMIFQQHFSHTKYVRTTEYLP